MREIVLKRFAYTPYGTMGRLTLPSGLQLYSLEPPWQDNAPNVSCIPEGRYRVQRDTSGRFRFYRLLDIPGRSDIEIHPANYVINPRTRKRELAGCIALGYELLVEYIAGIRRSEDACYKLLGEMGADDFWLCITQYKAM